MKIEDQVTSLELSKRLKELGIEQNSIWYWCDLFSEDWKLFYTKDHENDCFLHCIQRENSAYSAFTASELGEMLPIWTETVKRLKDDFVCIVMDKNSNNNWHSFSDNEVNARAKMLIYLIENRLIDINKLSSEPLC